MTQPNPIPGPEELRRLVAEASNCPRCDSLNKFAGCTCWRAVDELHGISRGLALALADYQEALGAAKEALEREQSFRGEVVDGILVGRLNTGRMRGVAEKTRAALAKLSELEAQRV